MGLGDSLMRLLRRDKERFKSLRSDEQAMSSETSHGIPQQAEAMEIQRDSLELGLAAGYTGRTLRDVDSSLHRIELQMATKDWITANLQGTLNMLIDMQKNNQNDIENMRKRLEIIEKIAKNIENEVISHEHIEKAELTAKMREVVEILQQVREISYDDLAQRLGISVSSLRGLLSIIARRTGTLQRFDKDRKGWVKYVSTANSAGSSDSNRLDSDFKSSEQQF